MRTRIAMSTVAALVALTLPYAAASDSGHGHEGMRGANEHAGHEGHAAVGTEASGLGGAWAALVAARDAIAADVESGSLASVHAKAEPVPRLAADVLAQSSLEASKRARVEGAVKQIGRVADSLHEAADAGDASRTRKELERLDGLLELIRAQYPEGVLSSASHSHDGHSGHAGSSHAHGERPAGVVDREAKASVLVRAFDPFRFEPKRVELEAGVPTRIELQNKGSVEHSLVVKTPDGSRDWVHLHVPVGATDVATYEIDRPGTYPLLCTIEGHTEGGMVGELVVRERSRTGGAEHTSH